MTSAQVAAAEGRLNGGLITLAPEDLRRALEALKRVLALAEAAKPEPQYSSYGEYTGHEALVSATDILAAIEGEAAKT